MAEMIGPKLGFEPVGGLAERASHDAGGGDDEVERSALVDQRIGADAYAVERGEIELHELDLASVPANRIHARSRALRFREVTGRAHNVSAVSHERARRLDAEAGRYARHQYALAVQAHAVEHLVGGGGRAKGFGRDGQLHGRHKVLLDVG